MIATKIKQRGVTVRKCFAALVLIALPAGHVFGQDFQADDGQYTPIGDDVGNYTPIGDIVESFDWESLGDEGALNSMCGAGSGGSMAFAMMGFVGLASRHRRARRR